MEAQAGIYDERGDKLRFETTTHQAVELLVEAENSTALSFANRLG